MPLRHVLLASVMFALAALIWVSPGAADPPVGTCPDHFETLVYSQPSPFFASVDLNRDGVVCIKHLRVTPPHPDPISAIDNNSQKPVG